MYQKPRLCLPLTWALYQKWWCLPEHAVAAVHASPNSCTVPKHHLSEHVLLQGTRPGATHSSPERAAPLSGLCSAPRAFPTASCMAELGEHCAAPPFAAGDRGEEHWSCIWAGLFAKAQCVGSQLHWAWPPAQSELLKSPGKSLKLKWYVPPSSGETVVGAGRWNARNVIASCLISNKWILLFLLSHNPSARFQSCWNLR